MKKFFLVLVFCLNLFGQTNFWTHHSLDSKINSLHKSVSGTFYAASDTSILKSNDYGISWDVVYTTPHPCYNWTRLLLFINKNHFPQDKLVVRQRNGSTACIDVPLIISLNGGDNWSEFNAPGFIIDLAINSFGNIYVVSDTNLYVTTNDGNNWQTVNIPAEDESILTVDIDTLNTLYIIKWGMLNVPPNPILSWNNIYRSTNYGQDWEFILTSGIGLAYGYSSIFNIPKGDLFASVRGPIETHHYFNGTIKVYPFLGVSSAHITAQGNIFLTTPGCCINQGIHVSIDDGITWETENSGLSSLATSSIVSDTLGYLYTSTGDGIFKSNFTSYRIFNESTVIMGDTRIADTSYKEITVFNPFSFELSVDSITTTTYEFFIPNQSIQTIPPQDSIYLQVAFSPSVLGYVEGDLIFHCGIIKAKIDIIGNSPKPFLISDESFSFGWLNVGESKVDTLAITSESLNTLSIDSVYLNRNLVFDIEDLILPQFIEQGDTLNILLRFTPDTVGIFRDTLNIISNSINNPYAVRLTGIGSNASSIENNQIQITEFSISQNYPNPFNPNTTIKYQIPELSFATIKVYDVLGKEVATLVNQELPAGLYEVEFTIVQNSTLSSSIYFYQLRAGSFVQTKKMILMK